MLHGQKNIKLRGRQFAVWYKYYDRCADGRLWWITFRWATHISTYR